MTDRQIRRQKKAWRNRIVGTGEEAPDQLLANPGNWRIHPKAQQDALSGALDDIGWIQQVVVNQRTGHLVDGHLRVSLALRNNEPTVPVLYVDLDEREEALALATLDPIAAMAAADKAKLDELLRDVDTGSAALQEMMSDLAAKSGLEYGKPEAAEDPGAQIDRAEELRGKWGTERGQLWEIPSATVPGKAHRLLCGDSTSAEDVARLMGGEKAAAAFTDPPYAIYGSSTGVGSSVADDKMVRPFFRDTLTACKQSVVEFGHIYVCCDWRSWAAWWDVAKQVGLTIKNCIVWDKKHPAQGSMFRPQHELVLFAANAVQSAVWMTGQRTGQRTVTTDGNVWQIDRVPSTDKEHNAAKPVELVARAVRPSSDPGERVFDPFLGSGTTMVAAEQLGRLCYGMEIEPKYIAVALERLAGMGLEPRLT